MAGEQRPAKESVLPQGWIDVDQQLAWLKERMMFNDPRFVLDNWDCKYVNMRIDMRTGAAILCPGDSHE